MRFKLLTEIAMTMLKARLKQTLVAAVGVTFGITMFVTLLSFMNGLNNLLDGLIVNRTPHIRLFNEIEPKQNQPIKLIEQYKDDYHFISSVKSSNSRLEIYNSEKIIEALGHDKRVKGVSRKASTQVFFNDGAIDISGILNGIDVDKEISYYKFEDYVTSGKPSDLKNVPNSIILGKPLAEKLLANIGDVIQLTTPQGEKFRMKVMGYYQSGYNDFDKTQSFVSLSNLQKIIGKSSNYVTDIQIKLHDIKDATYMAGEYYEKFEVKAEDIQTANAQFESGTKIRTLISYAVGITLLIVAGFGIYNILNMMIYEKMDTIAILKATGFSGADVKTIFMLISLSIGFFGCIAGLFLGNMLCRLISSIPFNTAALPTVKTYPVSFEPAYYIIAFIFAIVTTFFAGWFPSRKASKVDPVIIIRGK